MTTTSGFCPYGASFFFTPASYISSEHSWEIQMTYEPPVGDLD